MATDLQPTQQNAKPALCSKKREGLYVSSMGRHINARQRTINTEEISRFLKAVFESKQEMTLAEFI